MRVALALLAFSLPALAAPPCDGPEPKDVACIMKHDRNAEPQNNIRYRWWEISGFGDHVLCGTRDPQPPVRPGRPSIPARISWNPYQWEGRCFPAAGETRIYCVDACWISSGQCSLDCSNAVTVIGVPAAEMRCCTPAGCGPC